MDAKILVEESNEKTGETLLLNQRMGSYFIDNANLLKKYIEKAIEAFNETMKEYNVRRKLVEIEEIHQ